MKNLKQNIIIGIAFVLITGTLSHFLYGWTGNNNLIGLFTPVNESVWEHMKLLFFPMLVYAVFTVLYSKEKKLCIISAFCFGILTGTLLIPLLFYAYTYFLGKSILVVDILIFILSVLIAFWISYRLIRSCKAKPYTILLSGLVCVLLICFLLFTYNPPKGKLFADPTVIRNSALSQLSLTALSQKLIVLFQI